MICYNTGKKSELNSAGSAKAVLRSIYWAKSPDFADEVPKLQRSAGELFPSPPRC